MSTRAESLAAARPAAPNLRLRVNARKALSVVLILVVWQAIVSLGGLNPLFLPSPASVLVSGWELILSGQLPWAVLVSLNRIVQGFVYGSLAGIALGLLAGAIRWVDDVLDPWVAAIYPIPKSALFPLFLLWFGLGNISAVLLVGFVSAFPILFNSWTGVKAVKEIWVRSAQSMGADDRRMFSHVILPGALPYILTGLRLGLAQAWRILVAVEMLAAVPWGLGWLIFGAREFLNTDAMMAGIVVIALIGLGLEKFVFQKIEDYTVVRWGMITS